MAATVMGDDAAVASGKWRGDSGIRNARVSYVKWIIKRIRAD